MPRTDESRYQQSNRTTSRRQTKQFCQQQTIISSYKPMVPPKSRADHHKTTTCADTSREIPGSNQQPTSPIHGISNDNTSTKRRSVSENSTPIVLPEIWSINMNGMKPSHKQKWKVKALSEMLESEDQEVLFVVSSETHFKPHHNSAEIHIEGYNIHRADRTSPRKNEE